MEFVIVVLALGAFGAFVYWRVTEARKKKAAGSDSSGGGGRDNASKH